MRNIEGVRRAGRRSWSRPAMCAVCADDRGPCLILSQRFVNGQRDKKGRKLMKSEGRSSEDASGITYFSLR